MQTDGQKLFSQGIICSPDEQAVIIHDSTYPPLLHKLEYGPEYAFGINMDRGGFGYRSDGTFFACLFDGTGGGGLASAFAAQDFTEEMLLNLAKSHLFIEDREQVQEFILRCSMAKSKIGSLNGDATTVFVDLMPNNVLNAVALGDSGIIHVDSKQHTAHLFETILKDDRTNRSDTGGTIGRGGKIYRTDNICVLSQQVSKGDFIILASDGLLDNLALGEEDALLSLIINSSYFDSVPTLAAQQILPDAEELSLLVDSKSPPKTALVAAKRLNHYLKAITSAKYDALESSLKQLEEAQKQKDREALQEITKSIKETNFRFGGKCDDCLLICLAVT